jgi:ATP-dependent DNA helicase DinG
VPLLDWLMDVKQAFAPDGVLSVCVPMYEYRVEQAVMAEAVASAIAHGDHLVVEAGTGVGKSLAYLVPAILSGETVIVSTHLKSLQDQLITKDIPLLADIWPDEMRPALLKGRQNYVCLEEYTRARSAPVQDDLLVPDATDATQAAWEALCAWTGTQIETEGEGDLDQLPLTGVQHLLDRVTIDSLYQISPG